MRKGYITAPVLGALWLVVIATTIAITMSFATGAAFRPQLLMSLIWGAVGGFVYVRFPTRHALARIGMSALYGVLCLTGFGPVLIGSDTTLQAILVTAVAIAVVMHLSMAEILKEVPFGLLTRHEYEDA
ncbi:MAG: carbohydrate ABC transporter permease, partial [Pseudomonadota bacterium]